MPIHCPEEPCTAVSGEGGRGGSGLAPPARRTGPPSGETRRDRGRRLERDREDLARTGWSTQVLSAPGHATALRAIRGTVRLILILPTDYPASPPRVFAGPDGASIEVPRRALREAVLWSPRRSVTELLQQAAELAFGGTPARGRGLFLDHSHGRPAPRG